LLEVFQFLLDGGVFLGHLLELLLPLVTILLKSLNFAFEVAGFDIRLAESVGKVLSAHHFSVNLPIHVQPYALRN
jgi:hypothetical protein